MSMHDPFFHYLYCRSTAELNTVSAPDPQTRRREESGSPRTRGRVAAPPLAGRSCRVPSQAFSERSVLGIRYAGITHRGVSTVMTEVPLKRHPTPTVD